MRAGVDDLAWWVVYIFRNVAFRPIDESDLETLRALRNDMTTLLQLGTIDPVSSEQQLSWWKNLKMDGPDRRYTIVSVPANEIVGMLRIRDLDSVNAHCEIGLDILPELRGKGYGRASYLMVLEYLFEHYNMHMVYLRVADFNDRAKQLYARLGFVETGRYREYLYRHGRYWDYVIMAMLRDQYLQLRQALEASPS
ncbi:MAG TPA: GNAT family protein [bacterium]|nr:GNAT family protein [bacterium]